MADKVGQILIRKGVISQDQLREALRTQAFFGGHLGSHLINLGYLEEAVLGEVLSEIHGVPAAPTEELKSVRLKVASLLQPALAVKYTAVPFRVEGHRMAVAIANPRDAVALAEISRTTGMAVVPHVAPEFRILAAIERAYVVKTKVTKRRIVVSTPPTPPLVSSRRDSGRKPAIRTTAPAHTIPISKDDTPEKRSAHWAGHPTGSSAREPVPPAPYPPESRSPLPAEDPGSSDGKPWRSVARLPEETTAPKSPGSWRDGDGGPAQGDVSFSKDSGPASAGHPRTLEDLVGWIESAGGRDELCRGIVSFMTGYFSRAAILAVLPDRLRLLEAAGAGVETNVAERFSLPLDQPSVFDTLREGSQFHLGPLGFLQQGTRSFLTALGGSAPPSAFIQPVRIRERTVAFLYADNGLEELGPIDPALWRRVATLVEAGLEFQILRKKLHSV